VSTFRPSFSPQFKVYPQPFDSCNPCAPKSPFVFNRLRALHLSCRSFCDSCPLFSIISALFDKNTGGGVSAAPSRPLRLFTLVREGCVIICLRLCTRVSPVPLRSCMSFRINTCESVSKQTTLTSFRINTCENPGGEGGTPRRRYDSITRRRRCGTGGGWLGMRTPAGAPGAGRRLSGLAKIRANWRR
jgi:hypothetical protein